MITRFLLTAALAVGLVPSLVAASVWFDSPPGTVAPGQGYYIVAVAETTHSYGCSLYLYKNSTGVASVYDNWTPVYLNYYSVDYGFNSITYTAESYDWMYYTYDYTYTLVNINHSPSASITGPVSRTVGESGTWDFSAADIDSNLKRWRFYFSTNPNPQWSSTSGGSASGSYTTSFGSPGQYTMCLDVEDWLGATAFASITVEVQYPNYTLNVSASPSGAGSVSGGGSYQSGATAYPSASANSGYQFSHWSGDASGSSNPASVVMTSNKSVTANFVPLYTLSTSASPGAGGSVDGGGTYVSGTTAYIEAYPASGYHFSHWSGAASGSSNPTSVTMTSNKSVTANFAANPTYTLTVQNGSGGASGLTQGTQRTITANTPATGMAFDHWTLVSGPGTIANPNASSTTFTMGAGNATVRADYRDVQAPTTPAGLAASALAPTSFTLTWNASTDNVGVTAYRVKQNGASLGEVGGTSKGITGLAACTTYQMTVEARDAAQNWSAASSPLSVTTPPNAPVATAATNISGTGFTANWNASTGATSYRLDVSTSSSFASFVAGYQNLDVGNVATRAVTGLSGSTAYYYRVRAVYAGTSSANSNTITASTSAGGTQNDANNQNELNLHLPTTP